MRSNLEDNILHDPLIKRGWKLAKMVWVPTTGQAIGLNFAPYVEMNPAGAVNVLMPAGAVLNTGLLFLLSNISAFAITMQSSAGAGFTAAIVLAANESTLIYCTGSVTAADSWRAIGTALAA